VSPHRDVIAALHHSCARLLLACLGVLTVMPGAAAAADAYRLASGDTVRIVVFGHPDLSGEFELDDTGRIAMPLVPPLLAAGLTASELETRITDALQPDYLVNPHVSVDVLSARPFFILGEVNKPGSYPHVAGMTVVNAVALAGGYTYRAARRKLTLIRAADPDKKKVRADETTAVAPGDVIEVPERHF
jgi:polysaccharide biosynthesis/export protein VpsN